MKKQITVSRNLYESVSAILHISRIGGLCPVKVSEKAKNFVLLGSKKIVLYSYFSVMVLVSVSVYGLFQNYQIQEIYNIRLRTVTGLVCTLFENFSLLFSCLLGTTTTVFYQQRFFKYLECLQQTDFLLGFRNLNKKQICTRTSIVTLTLTAVIIIVDISLWSSIIVKKAPLATYLFHALPFYLTYMYKMVVELHFWVLVYLIKVRLICLNEDLVELLQDGDGNGDVFLKSNEYINKKLIKVLSHYDVIGGNESGKKITDRNKMCRKVKIIINIHNLLVEAAVAVNSYFGINILIFLFGCLVHLLVTPYILYLQIKETKNHIFVASQLIWLICHISRLIFIIEPCQACKVQIQLTVTMVCKLLSSKISNEAKTQLRSFLEQLHRCKIQFTACSLVTIDRTLLATVTGTVTTYLVILFQFK